MNFEELAKYGAQLRERDELCKQVERDVERVRHAKEHNHDRGMSGCRDGYLDAEPAPWIKEAEAYKRELAGSIQMAESGGGVRRDVLRAAAHAAVELSALPRDQIAAALEFIINSIEEER